jgi:hypothetical protein
MLNPTLEPADSRPDDKGCFSKFSIIAKILLHYV